MASRTDTSLQRWSYAKDAVPLAAWPTQARTSLGAQSCTTTPRCSERVRRRDRMQKDDSRESARSVMCDVRCMCNMACMISENHQPHRCQSSLACFPPTMHASCPVRCFSIAIAEKDRLPRTLRRTRQYGTRPCWNALRLQCSNADTCFFF
jgi:hypothetical protein